jgi:hypothetical protein
MAQPLRQLLNVFERWEATGSSFVAIAQLVEINVQQCGVLEVLQPAAHLYTEATRHMCH